MNDIRGNKIAMTKFLKISKNHNKVKEHLQEKITLIKNFQTE